MVTNKIFLYFGILLLFIIFKCSHGGVINEFLGGGKGPGSLIPNFNFDFGVSFGAGNKKPEPIRQPIKEDNFGPEYHGHPQGGHPHEHPHGGPPGHHNHHPHPNYEDYEDKFEGKPHHPQTHGHPNGPQMHGHGHENRPNRPEQNYNNANRNQFPNQGDVVHITPKQPIGTTVRPIRSTSPKLDFDLDVRQGNGNGEIVLDPSKFNPSTTAKPLESEKIIFMEEERRKKRDAFKHFNPTFRRENLPLNIFRYSECDDLSERCVPINSCSNKKRRSEIKHCLSSVPSVCCNKSPVRKTRRPSIDRDVPNRFSQAECGVIYESSRQSRNVARPLPLAVGAKPVQSLTNTPWMVAIGEETENGEVNFMCGGSLLSDTVILTAAHCLDGEPNFVRLGELDFATSEERSSPVDIKIEKTLQHPDYRKGIVYNDIGLIFLDEPVIFNRYIRPICLPSITDNDYTEEILYLTGWGPERRGGPPSTVLKYATVEIFNNTYCNQLFQSENIKTRNIPNGIISTQICAGDRNGGKDACEGDSGGPLGIIRGDIRIIIGIISSGLGCGYKNFPGVYTRVYSFVPWIEQYL